MSKQTLPDYIKLTAADILGFWADRPERFFPRDAQEIKRIYHLLAKRWHTDYCKDPQGKEVFEHVKALRDTAMDCLANDTWQMPGKFTAKLKDGKIFQVPSDADHDFELGTMHIGKTNVTYVIRKEFEDLYKNALAKFGMLRFGDDKMRGAFEHSLPTAVKNFEGVDEFILTIRKRPDDVLLRDILPVLAKQEHLDCHVAWITSRMIGMAQYMKYAGLSHNGFTLDNIFVSPSCHTIGLFGGWWYAQNLGKNLTAVPGEAMDFLPDMGGKAIPATTKVDLEMARAASRELLGDRGGTRLKALKVAPEPMIEFLRLPSSGDAQQDLTRWYQDVMPQSFGARRFTELSIKYSDVYQPGV